jgi:YesN/AraC family two-component response regulator
MINFGEELKDKTILIVEDEEEIRQMNADILSLLIDRIIESVDGIDGLKKFSENKNIDLLIVDINMPKMDGITMCKAIRTIDKYVPIIITTGYDEFNYTKELDECNISKYLVKPVDSYKLIESIKEILL